MSIPNRLVDFDEFDPYYRWLGIAKKHRPPTYYQLSGVAVTESDRGIIDAALNRQKTHVLQFRGTEQDAFAARLLYEIEMASVTLLSPQLRREYDLSLESKRVPWAIWRRRIVYVPAYNRSASVGEGSEIVSTFAGVMGVILLGIVIMTGITFYMPWQKIVFSDRTDVAEENVQANVAEPAVPREELAQPIPQQPFALGANNAIQPEAPEEMLASIDALITGVDFDKRSISVKHGTKAAVFDVSRTAKITVDGKPSELESLSKDQAVTIEFNTAFDVAVRIDATTTLMEASTVASNSTDTKTDADDFELSIEATVLAVDLEKRSLVVQSNSKTITFDLSRKTSVRQAGVATSLDSIAVGQKATVVFDPEFNVITGIEIMGAATPQQLAGIPLPSSDKKIEEPVDDPGSVSIDVTIESIDLEKRSVTVLRKSKSSTLDVSRKAKITVDGVEASLETLQTNQSATITFDPELEVISRIEVQTSSEAKP